MKRRRDEESYKDDQLEFANGKQRRVSLSLALIHQMTRWKNDLAEGGKEGFKEERKDSGREYAVYRYMVQRELNLLCGLRPLLFLELLCVFIKVG